MRQTAVLSAACRIEWGLAIIDGAAVHLYKNDTTSAMVGSDAFSYNKKAALWIYERARKVCFGLKQNGLQRRWYNVF